MSKKIIIAIVVIILFLLGGAAFVMSMKKKSPVAPATTSITQTTTNKVEDSTATGPKSLKDLLAAGVPQKCTFKDLSNSVDMQGTSYISGGKVRGDFSTTVEGKTTSGHSIFDGKTSYVWMDGTSTGFKMEIDPSLTTAPESNNQQGLDLNKSIDYSCSPWLTDQSLFNPPEDVTFTSFSVPTTSAGGPTGGNSSLCASCNSLTGEQKTQCLTALKCN